MGAKEEPLLRPDSRQATADVRAIIHGTVQAFSSARDKFNALAEVWHEHNIGNARMDYGHPAYHQIIGMGTDAIPLLLDRLVVHEVGWVYALKMITGEQPAPPEARGEAAVNAWLEWGRSKGFLIGRL